MILLLREHMVMSRDIFGCHNVSKRGEGSASNRKRPRMLVNILRTQDSPLRRIIWSKNINSDNIKKSYIKS